MSLHPSIDYERELNPEQLAAVTAEAGPALVLAGAGSGKTRTLTYRVAYLVEERRVHPGDILLLTFTNKAAREMLDRVADLVGEQARPYWGGTFHSVGGRILRRQGPLVGLKPNFTILDEGEADSLLGAVLKQVDPSFTKNKENPKTSVIGNLLSYARNTQQSFEQLIRERYPWREDLAGPLTELALRYQERKLKMQVADYDDLLVYWRDLLRNHAEVRQEYARRFRWILVDEYQDTNSLQSEIIDLMGSHHNIMAVGDDAQCIYTWRGANVENILAFPERHPGTTIYKIVRNYRSTPEILDLANSVLAEQPLGSGYEKKLVAARPSSQKPFVVPLLDTKQQALFILERLNGLYDEGYRLSDIAILYRAHFQALDLQLEFSRRGIPFVITSGVKFFEQAHIRDFVAQLRVLSNPQDDAAFERLFGLLPKVGPVTVRKVLALARKQVEAAAQVARRGDRDLFAEAPASAPSLFAALASEEVRGKIPADAQADYDQLIATLRQTENLMHRHETTAGQRPPTPAEIVEHVMDGWYADYIRNVYPNWESRRDDLASVVDFASRFETMPELLAQLVLLNAETTERSIEPETDAVRMSTVHQAKGLEFPVVFVLSCAEELFPLRRALEEGDVEEERRLFYVAVTRAKDELYLCLPMLSSGRGGPVRLHPSQFVTAIPGDKYEKLGFRSSRW